MITIIRKQFKTKILRTVLFFCMSVFMIVFMLQTDLPSKTTAAPSHWVMKVDGKEIGYDLFARTMAKYEANIQAIREHYGAYAQMFLRMVGLSGDLKQNALDELSKKAVLNDVAKSIPLYLQDAFIEQRLNNTRLAQQSGLTDMLPFGFFGQHGLEQKALSLYLCNNRLNMKQFDDLVRETLSQHIVYQLATIAAYVPSYIVTDYVHRELAARDYDIITFWHQKIIKDVRSKPISQEALQQFFDAQNKESKRYWLPDMRGAKIWTFDPHQYGIVITDQEVQDYYEKYRTVKYIEVPAQVQVRRILLAPSGAETKQHVAQRAMSLRTELLAQPSTFEQKAREYSQDKESASKGGLLPLFAKGDREQIFERKAFMLAHDGDISDVFESSQGYEIVQRVEKKQAKFKSFVSVKNDIHDLLLKQAFEKRFAQDIKNRFDLKKLQTVDFDLFVQEKHALFKELPLSAKDDSQLMQLIFKLKKNNAGFYMQDGVGYVVLLTEIRQAYAPTLDAVRKSVEHDYVDQQTQLKVEQLTKQASQALRDGASAKEVARQLGGDFEATGLIHQKDECVKTLQDKGIPVEKMFQLVNNDGVLSVLGGNGYIFHVAAVAEVSQEEFDKKKIEDLPSVNNDMMSLFAQGFVASLARNAKIEFSELLSTQ